MKRLIMVALGILLIGLLYGCRAHEYKNADNTNVEIGTKDRCSLFVCTTEISEGCALKEEVCVGREDYVSFYYAEIPFFKVVKELGYTIEWKEDLAILTRGEEIYFLNCSSNALYREEDTFVDTESTEKDEHPEQETNYIQYPHGLLVPVPGTTMTPMRFEDGEYYVGTNMVELFFMQNGVKCVIDTCGSIVQIVPIQTTEAE